MAHLSAVLVQRTLEELSEYELQSKIVEPLLRAESFEQVRDTSGPNENGRDLVATKRELGVDLLYAIQIKKLKVTNRANDISRSFAGLLIQLKQASTAKMFDPFSRAQRIPDRLIFITPFSIDQLTFDLAVDHQAELYRNQIILIDGALLAELAIRLLPQELANLRQDLGYRLRIDHQISNIAEGRAFGRVDGLKLDDIFVDMDYACLDEVRRFLSTLQSNFDGPATSHEAVAEGRVRGRLIHARSWSVDPLGEGELLTLLKLAEGWGGGSNSERIDRTAFTTFLKSFAKELRYVLSGVERLGRGPLEPSESRALCQRVARFQQVLARANSLEFLRSRFIKPIPGERELLARCLEEAAEGRRLNYHHLTRMVGAVVVTGPAGAGKTTLMRKLLLHTARTSELTPVFMRAIDLSDPTPDGVLGSMVQTLVASGKEISRRKLEKLLQKGEAVLIVDGLDEVGRRFSQLTLTLVGLACNYPNCPIYVSCRDGLSLPEWPEALHVRVARFSDSQLSAFVDNWFSARPSLAEGLKARLSSSSEIREHAGLPIIAATVCSVFEIDLSIPARISDLYDSRVDLLLGRWEQAKGIVPMRKELRERYHMFLTHLAYEVHRAKGRFFMFDTIRRLAPHYSIAASTSSFAEDCVSRGLLSIDEEGRYDFGHLTYQEFFVAKFLAHHNDVASIAGKLADPWWVKVLEFYATLQMDITPLMRQAAMLGLSEPQKAHLQELRALAPLTERDVFPSPFS